MTDKGYTGAGALLKSTWTALRRVTFLDSVVIGSGGGATGLSWPNADPLGTHGETTEVGTRMPS